MREQYKDIPSNSLSNLITARIKDKDHFILRVGELGTKNGFIAFWLSYAYADKNSAIIVREKMKALVRI